MHFRLYNCESQKSEKPYINDNLRHAVNEFQKYFYGLLKKTRENKTNIYILYIKGVGNGS